MHVSFWDCKERKKIIMNKLQKLKVKLKFKKAYKSQYVTFAAILFIIYIYMYIFDKKTAIKNLLRSCKT